MNKIVYWLIMLTWGLPITAVGFIITFILRCFNRPQYDNGYGLITTVGGNWGGLSIGPFAFCGRYNEKDGPCYNPEFYESTRFHEGGHGYQVLWLGIFWVFIVGIPSTIRYWYYTLSIKRGKSFPEGWYDSIWFERTATEWGTKYIKEEE